jgi:hypothetical protein
MSELAALQRLSTPIPPSLHTTSIPPSSPTMRTTKHLDQFNASLLLPRMPALSSRTPSLFEMQTMGYGFRGAHIGGGPHGVTPKLDSSKGAVDATASSEYRVEVPPCPSPRIQTQDSSMPIGSDVASWSTSTNAQNSLPEVDDQVQVSY